MAAVLPPQPAQPPQPPLTKQQIENAILSMPPAHWRRLEYLGKGLAAAVGGWEGDDLLQEAMTKFLEGARSWPAGLPAVVAIGTAMKSIASNERESNEASPVDQMVHVDSVDGQMEEGGGGDQGVVGKTLTTPEHIYAARQNLVAVYAAVIGDANLEKLVNLWAEGVRGAEARAELGWSEKQYEDERKRLFRRIAHLKPGSDK